MALTWIILSVAGKLALGVTVLLAGALLLAIIMAAAALAGMMLARLVG